MKRTGENDKYQGKFENLKGEKIGVVRGYQNTPEFDTLMDQGFFKITKVKHDLMNAKMLVNHRLNLIIGDPSVIRYSAAIADMDEKKRDNILHKLETVKPVIQYNHLYYAMSKKKPQWSQTREMLNKALSEFEANGEMFRIIQATNQRCGFDMETLEPYQRTQ